MEFKISRNVENGFKWIRMYAMTFAVFRSGVGTFVAGYVYYFAEKQREKICVLDNSKPLVLTLSQDEKVNRLVEAKEHVRRFYELFSDLAPDKKTIEDNIKRAFFTADKSTFNYYKDLAERGYYNRIISGNILQRVVIDGVCCDFSSYPYQVKTSAERFITYASNIVERNLITSCRLVNSVRPDNNPREFITEQLSVIENEDSKTVGRRSPKFEKRYTL